MNATNRLLDKWMETCRVPNFKAAAQRLHVEPSAVSNWRSGLSQATPAVIARMALELGESDVAWLALVESERSRKPEDRKAWAAIVKRLASAAAVLLVAFMPSVGYSASTARQHEQASPSIHYAKFWALLARVFPLSLRLSSATT